jgi:FkbM family methyltransferase
MIKRIIFVILCNKISGRIILFFFKDRIPNIRYPQFRFDVSKVSIDKKLLASLFWGFYESAEIRFVEKHFVGDVDAIELGASSGIVSAHIVAKFQNDSRRLIGVEANETLAATWFGNVDRYNKCRVKTTLLNNAVYYGASSVKFEVSTNSTESRISYCGTKNIGEVEVKSISLNDIIKEYSLIDYAMFCDIEGAELQIFLNEDSALEKCKYIFIELHDAKEEQILYTVSDLDMLIQKRGFELVDRYGPVCYYRKAYKLSVYGES